MSAEKIRVVIIMLFAVASVSLGETLLAKGMRQTNELTGELWAHIRGTVGNPYVILGVLLMTTFFVLYSLALKQAEFSFVLPLTGLTYVLGAALARYYLHESVTPTRWAGTLVITVGVIIVGLGEAGAKQIP